MSYLKTAEGGSRRPAPDVLGNPEEFPPLGGGKPSAPSTPTAPSAQPSQQPTEGATPQGASESLGDYGLMGILQIIRMTDTDLNALALGYDLTNLGLHLNSQEPVYPTLSCPWSDQPPVVQPEYRLPACYSLQPPNLRFQMFQRFHLETLFYIFYSMPRDVLQLAAAQELYNREWRFHKVEKVWLMRAPDTQPSVSTPKYERGNYVAFDPETWRKTKKEDFVLLYDQLENKSTDKDHAAQQAATAQQAQQQQQRPQVPAQQPQQAQQHQQHQHQLHHHQHHQQMQHAAQHQGQHAHHHAHQQFQHQFQQHQGPGPHQVPLNAAAPQWMGKGGGQRTHPGM
eukprot:TRINITY_DN12829_c0_g1_i1.p1 TRINITY_DN12829_c0_g1~~TRINITY_DN12829_c0_g1_i1.p1  ORF type:complete len:340 (+),score=89.35 TRINITY_DN12829_c0_g1_i1:78-1097(+)